MWRHRVGARLYNEAEIAILKIAADSLAAAIERQQKDDDLKRSEALYRSLFEISNEGIYRWELDQPVPLNLPATEQVNLVYANCRFTQANDAYLAMMGIANLEDIVNLRLIDWHVEKFKKINHLCLLLQRMIGAFAIQNQKKLMRTDNDATFSTV